MTDIAPHPPRTSEIYDHEPEHAVDGPMALAVGEAQRPESPAQPPAAGADEDTHPLVAPHPPPIESEKVAVDVKGAQDGLASDVKKGPKINLRILVISGQTHVYSFEPGTTIGRVKELIWNMWPSEWNKEPTLPATPSYFRLLYLGRLLADDQTLTDLDFKLDPYITIVHLSVRTFPISEEEPKKSIFSLTRPSASRANSAIVQSQQAAQTPNRSAAATTNAPSSGRNRRAGANPGASTSARNSGDGDHGGGCKCVIM